MTNFLKTVFAYIRVSTPKQGKGVSLQEQRGAIELYARRNNLEIVGWFEEHRTAAKRGRPVFVDMLKQLRGRKADGVIIHKIDRSARNLRDWADLGELIDAGVEVHFAGESVDLQSRGGRLSADIQAIVAADYVRNLREEARKGLYGRLKQGLYPWAAPIGYLDRGGGEAKVLDESKAPLVRRAFELYGTGRHTLVTLLPELRRLGLRNRRNGALSVNGLSCILRNPFYVGLIFVKTGKETFRGVHEPLVSRVLFHRVQEILDGRLKRTDARRAFTFRRLLTCRVCNQRLVGERQKGHVYYRCHTRNCATACIREEAVEAALTPLLRRLELDAEEQAAARVALASVQKEWTAHGEERRAALQLHCQQIEGRLDRLTDAYLDKLIDRSAFEHRKASLVREESRLREQLLDDASYGRQIAGWLDEMLELAGSVSLAYAEALPSERRELVERLTLNRFVERKTAVFTLRFAFQKLSGRSLIPSGPHLRDTARTWETIIRTLWAHFEAGTSEREAELKKAA